MDFKRLAANAGTLFSRAVQFTEEKLLQVEKTELDAHLENLFQRADDTKLWTEKILKQTEVMLQPNPNVRLEEFLFEKLDRRIPTRANNLELLGECMIDAGQYFGPGTAYGSALIKCGEVEKHLGSSKREYIQSSEVNFLAPFRNFIEGDYKTIVKERKLLQLKRLDLDAAKSRLKKARLADAQAAEFVSTPPPPAALEYASHFAYSFAFLHVKWLKFWTQEVQQAEGELRIAQSEFERQAEITRLLLEGISSAHAHHLRCLFDFVEAQAAFYAQCFQYTANLQKQLSGFPSALSSNNDQPLAPPGSVPMPGALTSASLPSFTSDQHSPSLNELRHFLGPRKARVLYDYDAASNSELSLLADEVITVSSQPGMDSDWLMAERGAQKGKVPITYLELLN